MTTSLNKAIAWDIDKNFLDLASYLQYCALSDAAIQQSEWNASKFREKLICDMLSEMMAKYKKRITRALAKRVESLLEAGERDTWASIRNLFECNTEAVVSEFSDAAVSFNLNSSEIDSKSQHLREHARNLLEMKAREAADAGRVLSCMKNRFSQVLSDYENSMSWYNWTEEKNLDEVERNALSESLRILSIMAAMRFDEMPDQIEKVLFSYLMDRKVPDPSLPNTFMGATQDTLASDTWEEVSPKATTLLKPEDCKSLWMNFIEKTKPMMTGARSRQVDRLRQRFFHSIYPGGLAGDKNDVQPASGFPLRAEQIWKTIKENKDLDLPAMEVLHLAYVDMLRHLHYSALKSFKNRLVKRVKEASRDGFEASIDHIVQDGMHQFEEGCKVREILLCDIEKMKSKTKTRFYKVYNTLKAKAVRGVALGIGGMTRVGVAMASFIGDWDAVAAKKAGDEASITVRKIIKRHMLKLDNFNPNENTDNSANGIVDDLVECQRDTANDSADDLEGDTSDDLADDLADDNVDCESADDSAHNLSNDNVDCKSADDSADNLADDR
ncbi:hypothetical protein POTOM_043406 [Populus tomentosa]|uniref:Sey1/RHD3-like three-helix bundle domain-containing protein n=1 Tax=Populus tomentosa TaxID=118781 RepID=A0A8X7YMB9_POPTO|nr:hypothetical protein POTOM_043406 [Populus tomentosa]